MTLSARCLMALLALAVVVNATSLSHLRTHVNSRSRLRAGLSPEEKQACKELVCQCTKTSNGSWKRAAEALVEGLSNEAKTAKRAKLSVPLATLERTSFTCSAVGSDNNEGILLFQTCKLPVQDHCDVESNFLKSVELTLSQVAAPSTSPTRAKRLQTCTDWNSVMKQKSSLNSNGYWTMKLQDGDAVAFHGGNLGNGVASKAIYAGDLATAGSYGTRALNQIYDIPVPGGEYFVINPENLRKLIAEGAPEKELRAFVGESASSEECQKGEVAQTVVDGVFNPAKWKDVPTKCFRKTSSADLDSEWEKLLYEWQKKLVPSGEVAGFILPCVDPTLQNGERVFGQAAVNAEMYISKFDSTKVAKSPESLANFYCYVTERLQYWKAFEKTGPASVKRNEELLERQRYQFEEDEAKVKKLAETSDVLVPETENMNRYWKTESKLNREREAVKATRSWIKKYEKAEADVSKLLGGAPKCFNIDGARIGRLAH